MELGGIWESLNDKSWLLLDKLRLGDFFEDHGIPPIIFPSLVIILFAVLFLVLSSTQPLEEFVEAFCGDGICQPDLGEDIISCPDDCQVEAPEMQTVTVEVISNVLGNMELKLYDENEALIQTRTGNTRTFVITESMSANTVRATLRNPSNGKTMASDPVTLEAETQILIGLPTDFFDAEPPPGPAKATIRVVLKDSETESLMSAKVSLVIPNGASHTLVRTQDISGTGSFQADANQWYALIAEAPGYLVYDSRTSPIKLEPGQERSVNIDMGPITGQDVTPTATVCVLDQDNSSVSGSIKISSLSGTLLAEQELYLGCTEFELQAASVRVSTANLPDDCIGASAELSLLGNLETTLRVACGSAAAARIRVKVTDENGTIMTNLATITAWDSDDTQLMGSGTGLSLAMGSDGFTEYASFLSSKRAYFIVANLEGYATFKSPQYSVEAGQNRSVTLILEPPPEPDYDFAFNGVSYPQPLMTGQPFTLSVSKIYYGQTDITEFANLSAIIGGVGVEIAGQACEVTLDGVWKASCIAPLEAGEYDIALTASYSGREAVEVRQLTVMEGGAGYYFELTPHAITSNMPPIDMGMDIKFNGSPLDSPTESLVEIYYTDGGVKLSQDPSLSGSNGEYSIIANSPFPGKHRAEIYLMKVAGGMIYEQTFFIHFDSEPGSLLLTSENSLQPQILEPGERFTAYVRLRQGGAIVPDLRNVYATFNNQRAALSWDQPSNAYRLVLTAPSHEGIFPVEFELGHQSLGEQKAYVVDTTKDKGSECNINACGNIPEVRFCVKKHKEEDFYSTADTIRCIERGWLMGGTVSIIHCTSPGANRGDWNNNCELDRTGSTSDIAIMTDFLRKYTNPQEANTYKYCGDMDNDGDVDSDDLTCLTNVASGLWYGDANATPRPDGSCASEMKGGFCFDINPGVPGDLNNDGKFDSEDIAIMDKIVRATSAGVTPPQELLDAADFNQDGRINSADKACLQEVAGTGRISDDCLKIYNFGCSTFQGDLNGDGVLDENDMFLMNWAIQGRVPCLSCADMNEDGICDEDDALCLAAMINTDIYGVEEYCTPCIEKAMAAGRYGLEICNDGLDNDCSGLIDMEDPRCTCGELTPCDMVWDIDGVYSTDDFLICRHFEWEGWAWRTPEDVEAACVEGYETAWSKRMTCTPLEGSTEFGEGVWTCAYDFPLGFSCDNQGGANHGFSWHGAGGNTGPLCARYDCAGSNIACPSGWNEVTGNYEREGSSCSSTWGSSKKDRCTLCRFQYDICQFVTCGYSGVSSWGVSILPETGELSCGSDFQTKYTEECVMQGVCMGNIDRALLGVAREGGPGRPGLKPAES
jgi:hypothetical protein